MHAASAFLRHAFAEFASSRHATAAADVYADLIADIFADAAYVDAAMPCCFRRRFAAAFAIIAFRCCADYLLLPAVVTPLGRDVMPPTVALFASLMRHAAMLRCLSHVICAAARRLLTFFRFIIDFATMPLSLLFFAMALDAYAAMPRRATRAIELSEEAYTFIISR